MALDSWKCPLAPGVAGIYIIQHDTGVKCYVGSATDLRRRRGEHLRALKRNDHENEHLQRAWNKYGIDAFTFSIVETCEPEQAVAREQAVIDEMSRSIGWRNLYNESRTAGSRLGVPQSAETRAKMSRNNTRQFQGKSHNEETRQLIAELSRQRWKDPAYRARYVGKRRTPEQRKRIGDSHRGRVISEEIRAKISASSKGRSLSAEHIAKLAASPRFAGRHHSEETKAKIRKALAGRVFSEEERRKISEGVKRSKERQRQERDGVVA